MNSIILSNGKFFYEVIDTNETGTLSGGCVVGVVYLDEKQEAVAGQVEFCNGGTYGYTSRKVTWEEMEADLPEEDIDKILEVVGGAMWDYIKDTYEVEDGTYDADDFRIH